MRNFVIRIVNGKAEEGDAIISLLSVGFLTGIFIATFDVGAITLFLQHFDEKKDVPRAFILSGILGVAITYLFNKLQRLVSYQKLVKSTIFLIALVVTFLSLAINLTTQTQLIFAAYVLFPPINAMVVLLFWGVFGRVFSFRSAKRLASGIDTGQVVATIIAFFAIPFIQQYLISETKTFLYISSACLLVAYLVYLKILGKHYPKGAESNVQKKVAKKTKNAYKKYIILLSGFVICSALAAAFIEYSFLTVTAEKFSDTKDTRELTSFISFFSGTVMICSFLIQTFLNDKILEMYGLRNTLLLLPGLLFVFGIISTLIGHVFGINAESVTFLFFFLIISISKLFSDALRDSLEGPIFKNFFFPIDKKLRFTTQSAIEGMVKESAGFIAGLLMMLAGLVSFYDVIFNNYILFGIIAVWVIIVFFLYQEYHSILTSTLLKNKKDIFDKHNTDYANVLLTTSLSSKSKEAIFLTLKLTERIKPYLLDLNLPYFAKEKELGSQKIYLQFINENICINLIDYLESVQQLPSSVKIRPMLMSTIQELKAANKKSADFNLLAHLASSSQVLHRQEASKMLRYFYKKEYFNLLLMLIRDYDLETKRNAIVATGEHKVKGFLPIIIESLSDPDTVLAASEALLKFGEEALQALDIAFYKNNQLIEVRLEIIALLGEIKGDKAIKMLLKKIDYPDHRVLLAIFNSLKLCQWSGEGFDVIFVKNALNTLAGALLWNLVTLHELKNKEGFQELRDAIKYEVEENKRMIFSLLALLYENRSIDLVQENIKNGTSESIGFAIELLDIILEDELKPYIPPLLDDSPILEKYKKLEIFFPREKMDEYELMLALLNRDYNWTNRWTKICALNIIKEHPQLKIDEALAANIFNPDPIIRELAAEIIYKSDQRYYKNLVARTHLDMLKFESGTKRNYRSIYQIFEQLRTATFFKGFPALRLTEIAEFTQVEFYSKEDVIYTPDDLKDSPTFLLVHGLILLESHYTGNKEVRENTFVSELALPFKDLPQQKLTALTKVIILRVHTAKLYKLLKTHPELIQLLLKNSNKIRGNYLSKTKALMSNI